MASTKESAGTKQDSGGQAATPYPPRCRNSPALTDEAILRREYSGEVGVAAGMIPWTRGSSLSPSSPRLLGQMEAEVIQMTA